MSERIDVLAAAVAGVLVAVADAENGEAAASIAVPDAAELKLLGMEDAAFDALLLLSADTDADAGTDSSAIRFCLATKEAGGGSVDSLAASAVAATHADGGDGDLVDDNEDGKDGGDTDDDDANADGNADADCDADGEFDGNAGDAAVLLPRDVAFFAALSPECADCCVDLDAEADAKQRRSRISAFEKHGRSDSADEKCDESARSARRRAARSIDMGCSNLENQSGSFRSLRHQTYAPVP